MCLVYYEVLKLPSVSCGYKQRKFGMSLSFGVIYVGIKHVKVSRAYMTFSLLLSYLRQHTTSDKWLKIYLIAN
jgi:hypothetical protein